MNIKIIAVGKIKEKYFEDAISEFTKRLSGFCSFSIIEIPAEAIKDENLAQKYMKNEAEKILAQIKPQTFVITMEIEGKELSSTGFAQKIKQLSNEGHAEIAFIIGGANGLHQDIKNISNFKLSMSKMTFPHQIARLNLIEQIYRAFKINNNEAYHR
ncbi:23S rRNA (pseudouridine(1915)-N(3))-methyltransferase RlmH [bacterium]|nr:23S rRNA (pseudouridine(1915)-N(3))-methyltransferase RlmH [bacterium]